MSLKRTIFLFLVICSFSALAQNLYTKAYGKEKDKPVIFLHGGPGYNSANFEGTTAKKLADNGFYVIVYDRRGEGRSKDSNAKFNFEETFNDLNGIYKKYNIKNALLLGHSFGGIVGTLFAEKNPAMVNSVFLIGAPVSLQETFRTILNSCEKLYLSNKDSASLKQINELRKLNTSSAEYYSECFSHAAKNRFYSTKKPSDEMKNIYKAFAKDSLVRYSYQMTIPPPLGFLKNENYTSIDLSNNILKLIENNTKVFGIYGKDDGLYSRKQIDALKMLIGDDYVQYLENCSHNVFIDQQSLFIEAIVNWTK